MSRIGRKPVDVPKNTKVAVDKGVVSVEGPKGKLSLPLHARVEAVLKDNQLSFQMASRADKDTAFQGTMRSLVFNMIKGVTDGFVKELAIEGVGFKAQVQGKALNLSLGFTHPVLFNIPEGLTVETPKPTQVIVKGADKVRVGDFAAKIRKVYPAEPYKGKGVRYLGEVVRRKAGKTVTK